MKNSFFFLAPSNYFAGGVLFGFGFVPVRLEVIAV